MLHLIADHCWNIASHVFQLFIIVLILLLVVGFLINLPTSVEFIYSLLSCVMCTDLYKYSIQMPYLLFTPYHLM